MKRELEGCVREEENARGEKSERAPSLLPRVHPYNLALFSTQRRPVKPLPWVPGGSFFPHMSGLTGGQVGSHKIIIGHTRDSRKTSGTQGIKPCNQQSRGKVAKPIHKLVLVLNFFGPTSTHEPCVFTTARKAE